MVTIIAWALTRVLAAVMAITLADAVAETIISALTTSANQLP